MIVLAWNCRGLGNPRAVRDLRRMLKLKKPNVVFLMETKLGKNKMELIRIKMGFSNLFVVDSVGRSGGLALLWDDDTELEIQNYSRRHINAVLSPTDGVAPWKFTGFYGHPDVQKRHEAWGLLRHLASLEPVAWLCAGDFNEIVDISEKFGGAGRAAGQMNNFSETLAYCNLMDLGNRGHFFTWNNGQEGGSFTQERLDRVVANSTWCEMFQVVDIANEVATSSDHTPFFITINGGPVRRRQNRRFFYAAEWGMEKECKQIIKQVWRQKSTQENKLQALQNSFERCKSQLMSWQRKNRGSTENILQEKHKELVDL
jgi:hypothetical protein